MPMKSANTMSEYKFEVQKSVQLTRYYSYKRRMRELEKQQDE